jgi:dolichol-phosphate mannosyltransferase
MSLSIIIPFYNEAENVQSVIKEVRTAQPQAEIVAVNDGSRDDTGKILDSLQGIQVIHFEKNLGQSAAMFAGLRRAKGEFLAMMDGDGQNDPADLQRLLEAIPQADMVCGYRQKRNDSWSRRLASRIANNIRRSILHDGIRDTGCSLKLMRREFVKYLVPFNGLHRYMPAMLKNAGARNVELPVNHRPRQAGVSKYTIGGRALRGIHDLVGVAWLLKRQVRWNLNLEI